MRRFLNRLFCLGLLFFLGFNQSFAQTADSDADGKISGEINVDTTGPQRTSLQETTLATIEYFKSLGGITTQLEQGASTGAVPALDENQLTYLNAAYLYCAINFGECPMLLDAIMEIDIINSRIAKSASCPNMTKFWKLWVKNDMEARHKYQVKTGYLKVTSDFNSQKRPAYLKCAETIKIEIADKVTDSAFFKSRYNQDSAHALVAVKAAKLLEDIRAKAPNIFAAVGTSLVAGSHAGASVPSKRKSR